MVALFSTYLSTMQVKRNSFFLKLVGISPFPFLSTSSSRVNLIYFPKELNSLRTVEFTLEELQSMFPPFSLANEKNTCFFLFIGTKDQREPFVKIGDCPDVFNQIFLFLFPCFLL